MRTLESLVNLARRAGFEPATRSRGSPHLKCRTGDSRTYSRPAKGNPAAADRTILPQRIPQRRIGRGDIRNDSPEQRLQPTASGNMPFQKETNNATDRDKNPPETKFLTEKCLLFPKYHLPLDSPADSSP